MTTRYSPPIAKFHAFDSNGDPLASGKLYTYVSGTTTPLATYTDANGSGTNTNPVTLDARGEADVWLGTGTYTFVLKTSAGATIWTVDGLTSSVSFGALSASSGASLIGYITSGTGATARTVQAKLRDLNSVKDFGAVGDGVTDDTTALQNAINAGDCYFPAGTYLISNRLLGVSNRTLTGPGIISTGTMYAAGRIAAIYLDGVSNFKVDGLGFKSDQLAYTETGLYLLDTTTPCSNITVTNCTFTNIKIIKSIQSGHEDGVGYPWDYYLTDANLHSKITVTNNQCTKVVAGTDSQGYAVWLFWCRDVVVSNNITKNLAGLAYINGGEPNNANWLVTYQASKNVVVSNNTAEGVGNGVVFIAVKDGVSSGNAITCASGAGEVMDAEGCESVTFSGNSVYGGQSLINTFFTANNVVFESNILHATEYTGAGSGNGIYNGQLVASDADIANSGRVVIRNNTFISEVGEAFIGVGWCKDMTVEGNRLTNVTIYSNLGTNSLVIRDNTLDFTISPTFKGCIYAGKGNTAKWTAATRSPRPKIQIAGNTVEPNLAGGVIAVGIFIDSCTQETTIDIFDNRLDVTTSQTFVLETGGGVRRIITFRNNAIKAATPFVANAPIATDLLLWKDNTDVLSAIDALGAITGSPATNLTVDAKAITRPGSVVWNNLPGAAQPVGWVYDSAGTTWRQFGVTY